MQARDKRVVPLPTTKAEAIEPITVAIDEEETLLAGLLFIPDAIADIAHRLEPRHFYAASNRMVYEACLSLFRENKATDMVAVTRVLQDAGKLEAVGGRSFLVKLIDRCVLAHHVSYCAEVIIEKYQRRDAITKLQQAIEIANSAQDWQKGRSEIEGLLFALTQDSTRDALQSFADLAVTSMATLEERAEGGAPSGVATGFYDLDAVLAGLRPGLHVIAGRASMGKTTFACNIARNIAKKDPVIIFSLEMNELQIYERLLSAESEATLIELSRAGSDKGNEQKQQFWQQIFDGMNKLSGCSGYIDSSPEVSPTHILSVARRIKAMHGGKLGAIVVDYLQLMEPDGGDSGNRVQDLSKLTRRLKIMSGKHMLNCPIIALSQLSRETEQGQDKRPKLNHLRESGSIEQDADTVITIYRDEYYNAESCDRGVAEIGILKNREGPRNVTVKLLYQPEYNLFRNLKRYGN